MLMLNGVSFANFETLFQKQPKKLEDREIGLKIAESNGVRRGGFANFATLFQISPKARP